MKSLSIMIMVGSILLMMVGGIFIATSKLKNNSNNFRSNDTIEKIIAKAIKSSDTSNLIDDTVYELNIPIIDSISDGRINILEVKLTGKEAREIKKTGRVRIIPM